jgi:hypothetical protein
MPNRAKYSGAIAAQLGASRDCRPLGQRRFHLWTINGAMNSLIA